MGKNTKFGVALTKRLNLPDTTDTWDKVHVVAVAPTLCKAVLMDQLGTERLNGGAFCTSLIGTLGTGKMIASYHPVVASRYPLVGDVLGKEAFGFMPYFTICVQCLCASQDDVVSLAVRFYNSAQGSLTSYLRSTTKDKRTTVEKQASTILLYPRYQAPEEAAFLKTLASSDPGHPECIHIPYICPIQWGAKELRIEFPNHY